MVSERSAIVTGASRGIGLGLATMLARQGYALTIGARDPARLDQAAADLRAEGAAAVQAVAGDLADENYLEALVTPHVAAHETLSVLVLNAGVGSAGGIAELAVSRLDKTFAVNWRAPYLLVQQALPHLRADASRHPDRAARIVVLSSLTGIYAESGLAAYGASKAALNSLVDAVNAEEAERGVLATAVAPGYVDTDMSGWVQDRVPADEMIRVDDIVHLVRALLDLSRAAVLPRLVVSRASSGGYLA